MLKRVYIKDYNGLKDVEWSLSNFQMIYGRNSIGKSRLFRFVKDFLNFDVDLSGCLDFECKTNGLDSDKVIKTKVEFERVNNVVERFVIKSNVTKKILSEVFNISKYDDDICNKFKFSSSIVNLMELFEKYLDEDELLNVLKLFSGFDFLLEDDEVDFQSVGFNISVPKDGEIKVDFDHIKVMELFKKKLFTRDERDIILKTNDVLVELIKKIDSNFESLEIKFDNVLTEGELYKISEQYYSLKDSSVRFDLSQVDERIKVSRGVRNFINVFRRVEKLLLGKTKILFLDEADAFIHDALYSKFFDFILSEINRSEDLQIVSITHNTSSMFEMNRKFIYIMDEDDDDKIRIFTPKGSWINNMSNIENLYRNNFLTNQYIFDTDFVKIRMYNKRSK